MKKILEAMDSVKAKAEVNSSGMRKFLQVVKEAELNQKPAPVTKPVVSKPVTLPSSNLTADEMVAVLSGQKTQAQIMADREAKKADPRVKEGLVDGSGNPVSSGGGQPVQTAQAAPAKPQVDPKTYKVPNVEFLKKNYKHPADVIDGSHPSTTDPARIGAWAGDSDFADLMMALNGSYYQARKADPNFEQPAFVKDDWELVQRMLGTPEGREYAIANWIGLSNVNDTSPEAEFNRAQHKEFEKQANARFMQQPDGVVTPGWKYDQKLGMTPAQAELQKQKAQQPVAEEVGMSRLLSIVTEGKGPLNRSTTAEAMTMQHYAGKKTITNPVLNVAEDAKPSMIGKYFKTVEQELKEAAARPNERAQQLAKRVIERVGQNADGSLILPDPGVNRLAGKPNPPAAEPAPAPSNVKPGGATVEYGGETYDVMMFGDKGIRPKMSSSDKVVSAKVYTRGNRMFVMLDAQAQEGVAGPEKCWPGHRKVGTQPGTGKNKGKRVNDCEKIKEDTKRCMQCGMTNCTCSPGKCKCKPIAGWVPNKGFKKAVDEAANAAQQAAIAIAKKKAGKK